MSNLMTEFAEWDNFYMIIGSAAGALIGLQFVALTLMSQRTQQPTAEAGSVFATPTIVHFGAALLLAALLHAPWRTAAPAAVLWGLMGVIGVIYACRVAHRMGRQTVYKPGSEDWAFYFMLPVSTYAILMLSALAAISYLREALFAVGASALLFLFIGIHNSWDTVTYHVFTNRETEPED